MLVLQLQVQVQVQVQARTSRRGKERNVCHFIKWNAMQPMCVHLLRELTVLYVTLAEIIINCDLPVFENWQIMNRLNLNVVGNSRVRER